MSEQIIAKLFRERRAMLRLLILACDHIHSELYAAGSDEVKQHPILRAKAQFLDRTKKKIRQWENPD